MDAGALNGLRGLLAFHIMVHHVLRSFFSGSSFYVHTYGFMHMPFFYLLSGFCLALAYGRTQWTSVTKCCSTIKSAASHEINHLGDCDGDQGQIMIIS